MKKINYRGQESGVRSQVFIPHPASLILKKLLLSLSAAFCLLTGTAWAEQVADYTAYPPFLPRVTSPNILFMLDYSKSMVRPAYGTCKSVSDYSDAGVVDSTTADTDVSDCRTTFNQIGVGEITLTGTVSVTTGSAIVTGTSTQFSTALSAGNTIRIKNVDYTISSIASATSLTLSSNYMGTTESGLTVYKAGALIGTVSVTNGSATVTGTGTSFSTELAAGGTIILKDVPYTISSIASDTSLTLASNYSGTTAAGFTARKGDAYSKVTPYSGYFDNGYSGSGSYSDSSAYKYTCTAASNGTCAKDSSGVWNGNWLNWLTATQFDILKKVAIGGDVNPAPEQAAPNAVRSILTDGYTFRKTMALKEGDTNNNNILDYCEGKIPDSLCKMWPDMAGKYSWMSTPATAYYVFAPGENVNGSVEEASLPFPFTFYGNTYTRFYVNDNGWFSFTSGYSSASSNADMPASGVPNNIIAPFWDSLVVDGTPAGATNDSSVSTFIEGSAPNRIFHVRFEKMYHQDDTGKADPLTFEALLYEGSNHIVFQYNKVTRTSTSGAEPFFVQGKSATVGVENSGGTEDKRYLYGTSSAALPNQYTGTLLGDESAVFATPHLSFTVTPRSGTTDFQPAAPFNFAPSGANPAGYKVEITVSENASCTSEGVGCFYNKDRAKYYNHQTVGLLQDFRDGELGGTLGFRLGIMQLNATDGGSVVKHFNAKDTTGWASLMTATRSQTPLTNTPLAEALYEATGYFSETESWDYGSDWTYHSTSSTCAATGTNYDPYCFQSAAQRVSCCKSFILLVSSGNYSNDNRTNIYGDADDANGTIPAGALKAIDGGSLTSGTTGEGTKLNGGYLDNVAYKAHTTDWRSDLEGTQNLSLYAVNTFGEGSGDGTNILKKAAKYGGFEDVDSDNTYDADKYNLVSGQCTAVTSGGAYGEDDRNCNGVPDTYFEASGGGDLKAKIIDAVTDILKSSASGTTVSVLSTSASGEGAIYQAYFYPAKIENVTEERTWPGYMRGFFLDKFQNLRDDYSGGAAPDAKLVMKNSDRIARMRLDTASNTVKVDLFADTDGDGATDGSATTTDMDNVVTIWEAGKKLALRDKSTRSIYTWADLNGDGAVLSTDSFDDSGEARLFTTDNKEILKPYLCAGNATCVASSDEAENIINFVRGNAVTGYRNRCITISGATAEAGCAGSNQRVWALGDIVYSTPTLVSGPGEKFDEIYGDSTYRSFRTRYANRRSVIYAGGNDGMLHAFNGGVYKIGDDPDTGSVIESGRFIANSSSSVNGFDNGWSSSLELGDELWAFVPHDNLPHLAWLACNGTATDPSVCSAAEYTHVYYVDQRPKVTDVRIFSDDTDHPGGWGTILIMGMRFGGGAINVDLNADGDTADAGEQSFRSVFHVFDITNPENPPKLLWRFNDSGLGFTTSYPAIAKICSNATNPCTGTEKWYMVVGSGPKNETGTNNRDYGGSNTTQAGKIYIVDLADGSLDKTFTVDTNTFMGDPTVVDADINFTSDVIYIGSAASTTSGKVYRINTNGTIPSTAGANWTVSTLFDPDTTQTGADPDDGKDMGPLLVGPSVSKDSLGNLWVFFGTGRLRSTTDLSNSHQQRFYAIKDGCWKGTGEATCTGTSGAPGYTYELNDLMNTSNLTVCTSAAGGKIIDPTAGQTCESASPAYSSYNALVTDVRNYKGWYLNLANTANPSEKVLSRSVVLGGLVLFTAYTPTGDMCSIFGDSAIYALYYETGTAYIKPTVGTSGTGATETVKKSLDLGKGMPTAVGVAIGETVSGFVQKSTGEIVRIETQPGLGVRSGAASWREKTGGGGTTEIETIYKHIVK